MKVHMWDEAGGEWSDIEANTQEDRTNAEIHGAVLGYLQDCGMEVVEDQVSMKVGLENVSFNIGRFGRDMLYVEMWGPQAQAIRAVAEAEHVHFTDPQDALHEITRLAQVAAFAVGD